MLLQDTNNGKLLLTYLKRLEAVKIMFIEAKAYM